MKKLLVLSDSHGNPDLVSAIVRTELPFDTLIFCGDGLADLVRAELPKEFGVCAVRGNVDRINGLDGDDVAVEEIESVRIFVTHGDQSGVRDTTVSIRNEAAKEDCVLIIFGHTHIPYLNAAGNPVVLNPGAVKDGSYATVVVKGSAVKCTIKEIG
jgi:putative phosphoesterase